MTDNITVNIDATEPEIAVSLDELRYLVFRGLVGDSAYDIAVKLGFEGTEAEWIASLKGDKGDTGADGVSPTVQVTNIPGGNRVTITDKNGPKEFEVDDGISPSVLVADIEGGHRVTITGAEGSRMFNVMDGAPGTDGEDGHSPYINNSGYWVFWNDSTGAWVTTNYKAAGTPGTDGHSPYIGQNGNWFAWDDNLAMYDDTGIEAQGADGVSPTVTVENITNGHRVTFTDAEHPQGQSFDVMDGDDYALTNEDKQTIAEDAANNVIRKSEFLEQIQNAVDKYLDDESMPKAQYTGIIIPLAYDAENPIAKVTSADALTFIGENLLDVSTKVSGKIKNDSGVEIADGYSYYFGQYIPVNGQTITANFRIQRLYYYDEDKQLLRRPTGSVAGTTYTIPDNVYFIQIQVDTRQTTDVDMDEACVHYGSGLPDYTPFKSSGTYDGFAEDVSVFGDGVHDVTITVFSSSVFEERVLDVLSNAIDDTLTISGDAADAAATGARISALQSSIDDLGDMILDKQSYSGNIIVLSADQTENAVRIESADEVTFVGENIFDVSTAVPGKILNNSGVETADSASYYCTQLIPVHGKTVKSNNKIQRFYYYDENKQFLQRSGGYAENVEISFPPNVYFVQIQIEKRYEIENKCVIYGDGTPTYTPFRQSDTYSGFDGGVSIFGDGVNQITITVYTAPEKEDEQPIPEIETYPFWEPETATDAYKCTPLGTYTQSIPALTDTLKYQGFLETYFDVYLGTNADGYTVSREDLGLDSGAAAADHIASPVYSYTFAPKRYNKTILLSAGMNTNEASTYFGLAYFIKALMEHTEDGMLALYQSTRFVVIPVICPSGIAHDPLLYKNSNNARINKNFEYYGSWERLKTDSGGEYPDSEVETKMLKAWLNKYAGADFYLDCHSDAGSQSIMLHLGTGFCSDSQTAQKLAASKQDIIDFYRSKGYFGSSDTPTLGWGTHTKETAIYPKTVYAKEVTNIPACMFEQFEYSTAWGSDGATNNDAYGIKHYAAMIRYMVLIMAK